MWLSGWSNDALDPQKALDPRVRDLRLGVYGGLGAGESEFIIFFKQLFIIKKDFFLFEKRKILSVIKFYFNQLIADLFDRLETMSNFQI